MAKRKISLSSLQSLIGIFGDADITINFHGDIVVPESEAETEADANPVIGNESPSQRRAPAAPLEKQNSPSAESIPVRVDGIDTVIKKFLNERLKSPSEGRGPCKDCPGDRED